MKNIYSLVGSFLILFFGSGCTSNDSLFENVDEQQLTPAYFSLASGFSGEVRVKNSSSNTILEESTSSMIISMEEAEWKDKIVPPTIVQSTAGNSSSTWVTGDQIGIYMRSALGGSSYYDQSNIPYKIVTGGSSTGALTSVSSPIYFPNRSINTQFFAYYPYSSSAGSSLSSVSYTLPADQSTQAGLGAADVMCSNSPIANGTSPNVSLGFNHKMVMLSFKINTTLVPAKLTKVAVSGQSVTNTGTLNLSTSTVTPSTTSTFSPYVVTSQNVGPLTYAYVDVIINPCTISSNGDMSKLKVTLSFAGLLDHSTNLTASKTFVSGTRYIYNLTVVLSL